MNEEDGVDAAVQTAWHVHAAIGDWTGRVDAKASFCLAVESALVAGVIKISGKGGRLSETAVATRFETSLYVLGVGMLAVAILFAAGVVMPQLRRWHVRRGGTEWKQNFVYFGHLRHWEPSELQRALINEPDGLGSLSGQLILMSQICWRKHSWVQVSMITAVGGCGMLIWCAALSG